MERIHNYYVYIVASGRNGTLYVGVTNDLERRAFEHRQGAAEGFTRRYGIGLLVWHEDRQWINDAIQREKNIKKWPRKWKLDLIESMNPEWRDLYLDLAQ